MSDENIGTTARDVLHGLLRERMSADSLAWLEERSAAIAGGAPARTLFMAFSAACRHAGKEGMDATADERGTAASARSGWDLSDWTVENAARTYLLLALPSDAAAAWQSNVNRLFEAADMGEAEALY
ncbi:MAG: EboA family metabolite traffic protein, partial [Planctomycetota bacterium]